METTGKPSATGSGIPPAGPFPRRAADGTPWGAGGPSEGGGDQDGGEAEAEEGEGQRGPDGGDGRRPPPGWRARAVWIRRGCSWRSGASG